MFRSAWTIGRVRGIPIRLHVSLLLVVPLFGWAIAGQLPRVAPAELSLPPVFFGVVLSIAVFVAIALHELGHALVALAQGARVRAITLMILGGLTEIEQDDPTPSQSFWMAIAGPLVNVVLAVAGLLLARVISQPDWFVAFLLFGQINLALAIFNLIPAFPLDGGRILQALLRARMSTAKATRVAAMIGRTLAIAGIAYGLLTGRIGLALIGVFVYLGAGAESAGVDLRAAIKGVSARQAMATQVVTVAPTAHVPGIARHMLLNGAEAALVRDLRATYGVLLIDDLRSGKGSAREMLADRAPLWVGADDPLEDVLKAMSQARQPAIVRDEVNAIIGVVTLGGMDRVAQLQRLVDSDHQNPTEMQGTPARH